MYTKMMIMPLRQKKEKTIFYMEKMAVPTQSWLIAGWSLVRGIKLVMNGFIE